MRIILTVIPAALLSVWLAWPVPAQAGCTGVNNLTGKRQSVREIYRTRESNGRNFIAAASNDPKTGRPLIIYWRRYTTLPGYYRTFVRAHECCHHLIEARGGNGSDEIAANCCAISRLGLRGKALARIGKVIISRDINSTTWIDYPGQGQAFWSATMARCGR